MKISIITVCYNAAEYIAQTIESVLGQSWPELEYIIVDGGSTDGTLDVVRRYAEDSRLRWVSGPDRGIADAMNKGVALAIGDIVAHLNADDYYAHPEVVALTARCFLANPQVLWVTGGFDFVAADRTFIRSIRVRRYSLRRLIRGNIILHPSTFIRREAVLRVGGFDPDLAYCMDYDLFLKLAELAPPLLLDEQLSCFRVHGASRTVTQSDMSYAEEFRVRCRFLRERGRGTIMYALDHQVKKILNRWLYRGLAAANRCSSV